MTARPGAVLLGVLRAQRRAIVPWSVAVAAVASMYTAFYPSVGGTKMDVMLAAMPPELIAAMGFDDIATAAGYVSSTVYGLLGAVLTLVCGIGLGARLLAGSEEDGTLELELTAPVARLRIYAERLVVVWLVVLALVAAISVVLLLLSAVLDLGLSAGNLAAVGLGLALFAGALGTVAFAAGAATGRRSVALGTASAVAVLAYLLAYLGPLVPEMAWMEDVSPYHWYLGSEPLVTGVDPGGFALLAGLALVTAAAGAVAFRRRDVAV
jgi:ABC-2 type transport system permease protein